MSKKNTETVTETETVAKVRGRRPSFPNRETVPFLAKIPVETRDMLRQVAAKREEPLNVTLNRFIENGFKQATRNSSKKS